MLQKQSLRTTVSIVVLGLLLFTHTHTQTIRQIVKFGVDNLIDVKYEPLKGKKIALLSNVASRNRFLEETAQVFSKSKDFTLCSILTPEHGYFGAVPAGEIVSGEIVYGIPTYSLYGKYRRPTKQMIGSCDAVVIDLQDVGLRPYTFVSTVYNTMDACAEFNIPVIILDRPNPLGGLTVDGNVLEESTKSFVGMIPIPYLHGMTIGELSLMINDEGWLPNDIKGLPRKCNLTVVKMKRWKRSMTWEDTQAAWFPTSPNMPNVNSIRGAAITGVLGELNLLSIGIGTNLPFQYVGAPYIKSEIISQKCKLLRDFNVKAMPTKFQPQNGKFAKEVCNGVLLAFKNDADSKYFSAGVELLLSLRKAYPTFFSDSIPNSTKKGMFIKVTGSENFLEKLTSLSTTDWEIRKLATKGTAEFCSRREKYLLYQ